MTVLAYAICQLSGCGSTAPVDTLPPAQSAAVKALEALGAKVSIRDGQVTMIDFYLMPDPGKAAVHLKSLPDVQKLNFSSTKVGDDALVHLAELTGLKELALNRTQVTDLGMKQLAGLTKLEILNLNEDNVTDAGLVHLKDMKDLKQLHLNQTKVSNAAIAHLTGLEKLEFLYAYGTDMDAKGAAGFRAEHPGSEVVVTDAADDVEIEPKSE